MMLRNLKRREGFTLIELMIVVAIIGILAAIAIPNFIKFQLRSKAGEGKVNLAAARTAEEAYFAEAGTYLDWPILPAALPGQQKAVFAAPGTCPVPLPNPFTPASDPGWCWIGWQPEGDVYYQYEVGANFNAAGQANQFVAAATSDIDGDLVQNNWGIMQPDNVGNYTLGAPPSVTCLAVLDLGSGNPVLGQVGPCDDISMGRNIF